MNKISALLTFFFLFSPFTSAEVSSKFREKIENSDHLYVGKKYKFFFTLDNPRCYIDFEVQDNELLIGVAIVGSGWGWDTIYEPPTRVSFKELEEIMKKDKEHRFISYRYQDAYLTIKLKEKRNSIVPKGAILKTIGQEANCYRPRKYRGDGAYKNRPGRYCLFKNMYGECQSLISHDSY